MSDMTHPAAVLARLEEIDRDLALRQNLLEAAAEAWFAVKRDQEHAQAVEFLRSDGTVAERTARAKEQTALIGKQEEAEYEALKAVVRVLETRASVAQSVLRAQGRIG